MNRHIFQPIPSLDGLPQPESREERLKSIISNLEKHHQAVRASILQEAKQKLESQLPDGSGADEMDLDSIAADFSRLKQNLDARYDQDSGDPCVMPGSFRFADLALDSMRAPARVQLAIETSKQLEAYDKQGRTTRDYYIRALERQRALHLSSPAANGESRDPRRRS